MSQAGSAGTTNPTHRDELAGAGAGAGGISSRVATGALGTHSGDEAKLSQPDEPPAASAAPPWITDRDGTRITCRWPGRDDTVRARAWRTPWSLPVGVAG